MLTLGSLFNGLGGWIIAGEKYGVKTLWESEVEKYCEALMRVRFPDVIQLGDVTKIDGAKIPPVDIICAGSPCQDLSVAGKREGLKGERSGLFRTAVDIVFGMRNATGGKYPRFFVWENVPGAFNSNKGFDFRAVLEEIGQTEIPMSDKNKWAENGLVQLPGCEIAWRILDAQWWVPQRRKRIFLVADFAESDRRAGKILFVEPGCGGDTPQGKREGQTVAGSTADSIGDAGEPTDASSICLRDRAGICWWQGAVAFGGKILDIASQHQRPSAV